MNKFTHSGLRTFGRASAVAAATAMAFAAAPANAYTTFFGESLNNSNSVPLSVWANATNAENSFKSGLSGVGTETFAGHSGGAPQTLTFPGSSGSLTATLQGGGGSFVSRPAGTTNGFGRYGVSGLNPETYWEVNAGGGGNFNVNFGSQSIAAFGFYGIDIGDFGGQLTLVLTKAGGGTQSFTVPNTVGANGSTDGSVLFFGVIAAAGEEFTNVAFNTTTGQGDVFAFDNVTIGDLQQVCGLPGTQPCPTPEPETLPLLGLGLLSLAFALRRKLFK